MENNALLLIPQFLLSWKFVLTFLLTLGGIIILLFALAEKDIFFTSSARENKAIAVMKGSKQGGEFVRWIAPSDTIEIEADGKINYNGKGSNGGGIRIAGRHGLLIPFVHFIDEQMQKWEVWNTEKNISEFRDEPTKYLLLSDTNYPVTIKQLEDRENFPVDTVIGIILRPDNAYKIKFGITKWPEVYSDIVTNITTIVFSKFTFDELKGEMGNDGGRFATAFLKEVRDMEEIHKKSFEELTGHSIVKVAIRKLDPDDTRKENREALSKKAIAELNATATIVDAKAKKDAAILIAEGDAKSITLKGKAENSILGKRYEVKAQNELTANVARSEAIENHEGTLVYNSDASVLINDSNAKGGTK